MIALTILQPRVLDLRFFILYLRAYTVGVKVDPLFVRVNDGSHARKPLSFALVASRNAVTSRSLLGAIRGSTPLCLCH